MNLGAHQTPEPKMVKCNALISAEALCSEMRAYFTSLAFPSAPRPEYTAATTHDTSHTATLRLKIVDLANTPLARSIPVLPVPLRGVSAGAPRWTLRAQACLRSTVISLESLGEEAEVVPVLLGELDERGAQRLGRLLDELLEIDHLCRATRDRTLGLGAGLGLGLGVGVGVGVGLGLRYSAARVARVPSSNPPRAHRLCPCPRA